MSKNGDAVLYERGDHVGSECAPFDLDAVGTRFLQEPPGMGQCLLRRGLIGHEGHVGDHHGRGDPARHGGGVMQHLLHRHRQGVTVTQHGCGERVAHQCQMNSGRIGIPRGGEIIGGQAGDPAMPLEGTNPIRCPFCLHVVMIPWSFRNSNSRKWPEWCRRFSCLPRGCCHTAPGNRC